MDLYIYSPAIEQQGVIDSYSSFRWRRRFFEPGEFELHVPATEKNLSLLAEGNIVHRLDRKEGGLIEGIAVGVPKDGDSEEITATGRFLSSKLADRIITPTINFSGAAEVAMRQIVSDNAITARPVNLLSLGALNGFPETTTFQATWKTVLDVLITLSKSSNIGFRVRIDVPNKALIFETYQGTDRTVTQLAIPYVLFSNEFNNIVGPAYTLNIQNHKNHAIVGGEGEGAARVIVTVDQTDGEPRRELWVDAKDLAQGDLTLADYQAQLTQRGLEKLAELAKSESFSADAVNTANFEYLNDWDLGDIVSFEKWGILLNRRITEVEEVDEGGVFTVTPVCGEPLSETIAPSDSGGYFEASTGTGDMSKSTYDTNNDGIVDSASNALSLGGNLASLYPTISSGTWTPTIYGAVTAGTPTYVSQVGTYYKIGKSVFLYGNLAISAIGGIAGQVRIGGLPFASSSNFPINIGYYMGGNLPSGSSLKGYIVNNTIWLICQESNGATNIDVTQITNGFGVYYFFAAYTATT